MEDPDRSSEEERSVPSYRYGQALHVNTGPQDGRRRRPYGRSVDFASDGSLGMSSSYYQMNAAESSEAQQLTYLLHSPTAGQIDFADSFTPRVEYPFDITPLYDPRKKFAAAPQVLDSVTPRPGAGVYQGGKLQFCDMYHSKYMPVEKEGWVQVWNFVESPVILFLVGTLSAVQDAWIDWMINHSHRMLGYFEDISAPVEVAYACFTACLACLIVHWCPQAGGSGMPEIKVVLSGIINKSYLSVRTFMAKSIGLVLAFSAGLSIGREGPFVQIACAIADSLMQLPCFSRIRENSSKRLELLACASAAGVSATFGTPFGGTLFSIEVTATFYMIRNLPRAFFAAMCGAVLVVVMGKQGQLALFETTWSLREYQARVLKKAQVTDMAISAVLGIIAGLFGVMFIKLVEVLIRFRDDFLSRPTGFLSAVAKKFLLVIVVTAVVNIVYDITEKTLFLEGTQKTLTDFIFHDELLDPNIISIPLFVFFPLKVLFTAICITLPIPAGLFTPTFLAGGAFGRCFGEIMIKYFPAWTSLQPWEFALVGACAYSSGVTRAISTAVIVLELTGHLHLTMYIGIAIICAYFIGNRFTVNVYDHLIMANDLPRLPYLPKVAYDIPSWEVMKEISRMPFLTAQSTYADAATLLQQSKEVVFPVVQDEVNMLLVGAVMRSELRSGIKALTSTSRMMRRLQRHPSLRREAEGVRAELARSISQNAGFQDQIIFAFNRGGRFYNLKTSRELRLNDPFIAIDPAPFQIVEAMPLIKVDLLFRMLKLNKTYVTRQGRLVGMISRQRLQNFLGTLKRPKSSFTGTIWRTCYESLTRVFSRSTGRYERL